MYGIVFVFLASLITTIAFTPVVRLFADKYGIFDEPGHRKIHNNSVPSLGGIAIYFGLLASIMTIWNPESQIELYGIIIAGTIILLIGIADDVYGLSAMTKLFGQIIVSLILVSFGVKFVFATEATGSIVYLGVLGVPLTVFWMVGMMNAINLTDGLDGLAAGVSCIGAASLGIISVFYEIGIPTFLSAAICGTSLGFLIFNFNPAKIFLGDSGAMLLGFFLGSITVLSATSRSSTMTLFIPILVLGVPIFDTGFAILRRFASGRCIFAADQEHLHHRLVSKGYTQKQAVLIIYGISVCLGVIAVLVSHLTPIAVMFTVIIVLVVLIYGGTRTGLISTYPKHIHRSFDTKQ
jgi:UDP-GlcNAc:undecaprenyl-phosphate GlcNAc-1-phosphate transferase